MIKYVCLISNSMASQCMINGRQTDLYCRLVPLATNNSCKLYIKTKIASCLVTKVKKDWQNCDEVPQTEMLPRGRKKWMTFTVSRSTSINFTWTREEHTYDCIYATMDRHRIRGSNHQMRIILPRRRLTATEATNHYNMLNLRSRILHFLCPCIVIIASSY